MLDPTGKNVAAGADGHGARFDRGPGPLAEDRISTDGYCTGRARTSADLAKLQTEREALLRARRRCRRLTQVADVVRRAGRGRGANWRRCRRPALVYAGTIHDGGGGVPRHRSGRRQAAADLRPRARRRAERPATEVGPGTADGDRRAVRARFRLPAKSRRGRPPRGAGPTGSTDAQEPAHLAVDRQSRLAVSLRPRHRRYAERLRPHGPAADASRTARLAGGRVPRRRAVAQGAAPADASRTATYRQVVGGERRIREARRGQSPTSGG